MQSALYFLPIVCRLQRYTGSRLFATWLVGPQQLHNTLCHTELDISTCILYNTCMQSCMYIATVTNFWKTNWKYNLTLPSNLRLTTRQLRAFSFASRDEDSGQWSRTSRSTIADKKLVRTWDSERELSLRRHRTHNTKYNRLVHKFCHRSTPLSVGTEVYQIQLNNAI